MTYGLPYQGSKSRIAKWIIDSLPSADTFIDLMAGGCAVSHAAILSGKYNHIVINDIGPGPEIFYEAMQGDGCVEISHTKRESSMAATTTGGSERT